MNSQDDMRRKRLTVRFHTSNIEKFLQARLVFGHAGVALGYFKESQNPYVEDYGFGKRKLLDRAVREIVNRLGANSLFFVEDTSVRIEALSGSDDFPGLQVKEWFQQTSFEQLDQSLVSSGNDRRAIVYSDIALFVPGLDRPVYVNGATDGLVATTPPMFSTDVEHPWLTPNTFNGWLEVGIEGRRLVDSDFGYDGPRLIFKVGDQLVTVGVVLAHLERDGVPLDDLDVLGAIPHGPRTVQPIYVELLPPYVTYSNRHYGLAFTNERRVLSISHAVCS